MQRPLCPCLPPRPHVLKSAAVPQQEQQRCLRFFCLGHDCVSPCSVGQFIRHKRLCHFSSVSGEKSVPTSANRSRPSFLAAEASRRFWATFRMSRLWPSFSRRMRFSSLRYSIASCCRWFIQPATATVMKVHGFQCMGEHVTGSDGECKQAAGGIPNGVGLRHGTSRSPVGEPDATDHRHGPLAGHVSLKPRPSTRADVGGTRNWPSRLMTSSKPVASAASRPFRRNACHCLRFVAPRANSSVKASDVLGLVLAHVSDSR